MLVTQKCQYALRALFDLARRGSTRPVKIAQIAEEQNIPSRFLEIILNQLKQGGVVESRRGTEGGYLLARDPRQITVGEIVRFIDGPIHAETVTEAASPPDHSSDAVFGALWQEAQQSIDRVLDGVTIADLVERDTSIRSRFVTNYTI